MIRVGFIGTVSKEWMGGLNYYKNLLFAISMLEDKKIESVVFVGKKTDPEIKNMFKEYADVIESSIFDRKSFLWFIWKITNKIFGSMYIMDKLFYKYNIQVLSHSSMVDLKSCKTINWIPDFQHLHLPEMFSDQEIKSRNERYLSMIKKSDKIVLSSYDALKDFKIIAPEDSEKVDVLQFVSQPDNRYFLLDENEKKNLLEKYDLPEEFFYLPNQFWKHKNHMLVFEAVKYLKDKQHIEVNIVCTGYMNDYRNIDYINKIKEFIAANNLQDNIKLLGLVDYKDVFALIKFSKSVINPSFFEGWSSTVEECKSVGKNMILSDIKVHIEQNPDADFFDKNSVQSLATLLSNYNNADKINIKQNELYLRTLSFANNYKNIVLDVVNNLSKLSQKNG